MGLFEWNRTGYGRSWKIEIAPEQAGTPGDLLVKQWPVLEFVKRPTRKDVGVYPRKLTIPIVDYDSANGYLRDAVFDTELECELSLNSDVIFSGVIYQSDIIKAVGEDEYDTEIIVSDGLDKLNNSDLFSGTYTYDEFLKELLWESGFELDIHFYTDWEEDNASAGLVDTHRLTYEGDTYMQVLQRFCNDFGYQVYQENNTWIVRNIASFAGGSATRYVITGSGTTSASVDLTESITGLYKSTDEDIIRRIGIARTVFSFDIEDGDSSLSNSEFESFAGGEFDSWTRTGTPTQIEDSGTFFARIEGGDRLQQFIPGLVLFGDRITIDARAIAEFTTSPSGTEDAEWLEIIFHDYRGTRYWLQNNGTVSTTQDYINVVDITQPTMQFDATFICVGATGFPAGFAGLMEVNARIDTKFSGGSTEFDHFDFDFVRVDYQQNARKFSKITSTATIGTLFSKEIELSISQNNRHYIGNHIEYNNGVNWLAAQSFDGLSFSGKRARDEVIVRNINMEMIRAEIDFADYKGLTKIYADGGKEFIPLASKITIGLDDVEVTFIRHERTADVISVSDEFS